MRKLMLFMLMYLCS